MGLMQPFTIGPDDLSYHVRMGHESELKHCPKYRQAKRVRHIQAPMTPVPSTVATASDNIVHR